MSDPAPPCQAFWRVDVVFSGTVIRVTYSDIYQLPDAKEKWNYRNRIAHFSVESVFRGSLGPQVDVIAAEIMPTPITLPDGSPGMKTMGESDCEYKFKEGERYLVYAHLRKTNDGTLMVPYNRTRPLAQANEDLEFIRGLESAPPGGRIYGQAKLRSNDLKNPKSIQNLDPVANARIIVEGMDRRVETATDSEGRYEVKGLAPGEYSVRAEFDPQFTSYPAMKARVLDRGCAQIDFFTEANGRISGKIFDAQGQLMPKMRLDLAAADQDPDNPNPRLFYAYADDNGSYEFKSIPPGRYLLGIRLDGIRDKDFAYPRFYYPGTASVTDAKILTVKLGEKLAGVDFAMPPPLAARMVEGVVIWPDGKPVPNAMLIAMITDFPNSYLFGIATTDENGRFSSQLFEGMSYWIKAVVNLPRAKQMHAEPIDIAANEDVRDLRLIVSSPMGNCDRCLLRVGARKRP